MLCVVLQQVGGRKLVRLRHQGINSQRRRFAQNLGLRLGVHVGSRRRLNAQQFFVTGDQVAVFVQIPDDLLGGIVDLRTD